MAAPFGPQNWYNVGEIIRLFQMMGCEVSTSKDPIIGPDGPFYIRFLYNPEQETMLPLRGLADDEWIPPSIVDNWERVLEVVIPRPAGRH